MQLLSTGNGFANHLQMSLTRDAEGIPPQEPHPWPCLPPPPPLHTAGTAETSSPRKTTAVAKLFHVIRIGFAFS
jgi:hypothetical protein